MIKKLVIESLRDLAEKDLVISKKKAVDLYFNVIRPNLRKIYDLDNEMNRLIAELEDLHQDENSPIYISKEQKCEEVYHEKNKLEIFVEEQEDICRKLLFEKESYHRVFPGLEAKVAHKVANMFDKEKMDIWYENFDRRERELMDWHPESLGEWEARQEELSDLYDEERYLSRNDEYYDMCYEFIFPEKSKPRSHILNLCPWTYSKN